MKDNYEEIIPFLKRTFKLFSFSKNFHNFNLQFRPLRPLMPQRREAASTRNYRHACSKEEIDSLQAEIRNLCDHDSKFNDFVQTQTNIYEIYDRYTNINFTFEDRPHPTQCPIPFTGMIVGAAGNCYPCLESAEAGGFEKSKKFVAGNFLNLEDKDEFLRIILLSFYSKNMVFTFCNQFECSQGEAIHPMMDYLSKTSENKPEYASPFF